MEVTSLDEVLSIHKERDIPIKRDVIESALEDPAAGLGNAEWVSKHLRPKTLLSKEELSLYVRR
jgi:hypothetical protein